MLDPNDTAITIKKKKKNQNQQAPFGKLQNGSLEEVG
jgi:hypothetical protein